MRAAIYARVSSQGQRERQTIENQLRTLPAFVASQGWTLVDTYVDDGRSAAAGKLEARDGFARLVRDADARRFDVVVVADIDRLTRTDDPEERGRITGVFWRNGIQIVTPSGGVHDLRTMMGGLYVEMQARFAAEENRKRAERTRDGKQRVMAEGRKASGPTPFGLTYDRETKAWGIDPVKAPLVRELFGRVLAGESCVSVARDFADRGAPAPRHHWSPNVAWRIVTSQHVIGTWCADRRRRTMIAVPQLVDEATWHAVQERLKAHGLRGLRRTRHVYLIEGLAVCGLCGQPIGIRTAIPARHEAATYVCRSRKNDRGEKRCAARPVHVADLDARAWAAISAELAAPELADALRRRSAERRELRRDWSADIDGYRAHLARLDKVETALLGRFRRGAIGDVAMDAELASLGRERAAVKAQIETAQAAIADAGEVVEESPEAWIESLRALAASAAPLDRQRVVRTLLRPGAVLAGPRLMMTLLVETRARSQALRSWSGTQHEDSVRIRLVA